MKSPRVESTHPVIAEHESQFSIRVANQMAGIVGSWKFIFAQLIFVCVWITLNVVAWVHHFDNFPFILLNLCMSTQAIFASPIILLAQNASYKKDRRLWESHFQATQEDKVKTEEVLSLLRSIHASLEKKIEEEVQKVK